MFSVRMSESDVLASELACPKVNVLSFKRPKMRPELSENAIEQNFIASEMCVCLKDTHSDGEMFRTFDV
jgi:hypothetical protein